MKVSVIIPCFNSRKYLAESIQSVIDQSYSAFEIIVVNDGSTDDSVAVASSFGSRVHVISQRNKGLSGARNTGLRAAMGDAVAFLDADDTWEPEKLEKEVQVLASNPKVTCVHSSYYYFGDVTGQLNVPDSFITGKYQLNGLLTDQHISPCGCLIRLPIQSRFAEWARYCEDKLFFTDLFIEATRDDRKFHFIDENLFGYRKHAESITSNENYIINAFETRLKWIENHSSLTPDDKVDLASAVFDWFFRVLADKKWNRDVSTCRKMQRHIRIRIPDKTLRPKVVNELIFPRIVYHLRDLFS